MDPRRSYFDPERLGSATEPGTNVSGATMFDAPHSTAADLQRRFGLFIDGHFVEELHSVPWANGHFQAVSYKLLLDFICLKLGLSGPEAFSVMQYFNSSQDRFHQDELEEMKFDFKFGGTKMVDGRVKQSGVDSDITLHCTEFALLNKMYPTTLVCVWGDMDFVRVIRHVVSNYNCQVHIFSWRGAGSHVIAPNDHSGLMSLAWFDVQKDYPMNVFVHLMNEDFNVFKLVGRKSVREINLYEPPTEASVDWAEKYLQDTVGMRVNRQNIMQLLLRIEGMAEVENRAETTRAVEVLKWYARTVAPDHSWVVFRSDDNFPVNKIMHEVVTTIQESPSRIVLVEGATGCGKSTQIPPALLDVNPNHVVYCTQPRRIAAKALATHVASSQKRDDVGYQIGGSTSCLSGTRLIYMTTGVLVRKVLDAFRRGKYLNDSALTHIFLDEIHERSAEYDILLAILRELMLHNRKIRLIVMSATVGVRFLQMYLYRGYLHSEQLHSDLEHQAVRGHDVDLSTGDEAHYRAQVELWKVDNQTELNTEQTALINLKVPVLCIGTSHKERVTYYFEDVVSVVENLLKAGQLVLPHDSPRKGNEPAPSTATVNDYHDAIEVPVLTPEYYARCLESDRTHYFDSVRRRFLKMFLLMLHVTRPRDEGILVFLSGLAAIEEMADVCRLLPQDEVVIIRLHTYYVMDEQEKALQAYPGQRKIILSTVLAESSLTITEIDHVIDTCTMKEMLYDQEDRIGYLVERPCSKDSCDQRAGRTGRVREGYVWRFVTYEEYQTLPEERRSGVLSTPLAHSMLQLITGQLPSPIQLMMQLPEAPNMQHVDSAIKELEFGYRAIRKDPATGNYSITLRGTALSSLPLDLSMSNMLLIGVSMGLLPIMVQAVCVLHRNQSLLHASPDNIIPFARRLTSYDHNASSDLVANINVYRLWLRRKHEYQGATPAEFDRAIRLKEGIYSSGCREVRTSVIQVLRGLGMLGLARGINRGEEESLWETEDEMRPLTPSESMLLVNIMTAAFIRNLVQLDVPTSQPALPSYVNNYTMEFSLHHSCLASRDAFRQLDEHFRSSEELQALGEVDSYLGLQKDPSQNRVSFVVKFKPDKNPPLIRGLPDLLHYACKVKTSKHESLTGEVRFFDIRPSNPRLHRRATRKADASHLVLVGTRSVCFPAHLPYDSDTVTFPKVRPHFLSFILHGVGKNSGSNRKLRSDMLTYLPASQSYLIDYLTLLLHLTPERLAEAIARPVTQQKVDFPELGSAFTVDVAQYRAMFPPEDPAQNPSSFQEIFELQDAIYGFSERLFERQQSALNRIMEEGRARKAADEEKLATGKTEEKDSAEQPDEDDNDAAPAFDPESLEPVEQVITGDIAGSEETFVVAIPNAYNILEEELVTYGRELQARFRKQLLRHMLGVMPFDYLRPPKSAQELNHTDYQYIIQDIGKRCPQGLRYVRELVTNTYTSYRTIRPTTCFLCKTHNIPRFVHDLKSVYCLECWESHAMPSIARRAYMLRHTCWRSVMSFEEAVIAELLCRLRGQSTRYIQSTFPRVACGFQRVLGVLSPLGHKFGKVVVALFKNKVDLKYTQVNLKQQLKAEVEIVRKIAGKKVAAEYKQHVKHQLSQQKRKLARLHPANEVDAANDKKADDESDVQAADNVTYSSSESSISLTSSDDEDKASSRNAGDGDGDGDDVSISSFIGEVEDGESDVQGLDDDDNDNVGDEANDKDGTDEQQAPPTQLTLGEARASRAVCVNSLTLALLHHLEDDFNIHKYARVLHYTPEDEETRLAREKAEDEAEAAREHLDPETEMITIGVDVAWNDEDEDDDADDADLIDELAARDNSEPIDGMLIQQTHRRARLHRCLVCWNTFPTNRRLLQHNRKCLARAEAVSTTVGYWKNAFEQVKRKTAIKTRVI
eukprot:PhM_4_TR18017/c0_g1_i1/m.33288